MKFINITNCEIVNYINSFDIEVIKTEFDPWVIDAIEDFNDKIPIPPTYKSFNEKGFIRLENHRRSFYYNPQPDQSQNVICFKGCEILSDDIAANIQNLASSGPTTQGLNSLEHFITIEQKVPACLLYQEAIREARNALEIQSNYYIKYKELAPMPFPIEVVKLSSEINSKLFEQMSSIATKEYFEDVTAILEHGHLGLYAYIFSSFPLRVANLDNSSGTEHPKDRKEKLSELVGDPQIVVENWIILFSRLLCLGYAPGTKRSFFTGHACDVNNATINGGFCDVGSIERFADISLNEKIIEAIDLSFNILCQTILSFLSGANHWNKYSNLPINYIKIWAYKRVLEELNLNTDSPWQKIALRYFNEAQDYTAMANQLYEFY